MHGGYTLQSDKKNEDRVATKMNTKAIQKQNDEKLRMNSLQQGEFQDVGLMGTY